MSLTLGEKLRQAREARGIPISEVADQTRIAPLYLESIDNDDYRALPGGIFNRGFIKSYAKYVGIDEQEALLDYAQLLNDTDVEELKTYKPQVLTDDNSTRSMIPTVIVAAIILGLMTGGILFLVSYLRQRSELAPENMQTKTNVNTVNANAAVPPESNTAATQPNAPVMGSVKVEFTAVGEIVSLTSKNDETKTSSDVTPGSTKTFQPRESLQLSYSVARKSFAQLKINEKLIMLPNASLDPKKPAIIEFVINRDNIERIWKTGMISSEAAATPSGKPADNKAR